MGLVELIRLLEHINNTYENTLSKNTHIAKQAQSNISLFNSAHCQRVMISRAYTYFSEKYKMCWVLVQLYMFSCYTKSYVLGLPCQSIVCLLYLLGSTCYCGRTISTETALWSLIKVTLYFLSLSPNLIKTELKPSLVCYDE